MYTIYNTRTKDYVKNSDGTVMRFTNEYQARQFCQNYVGSQGLVKKG